jgi:hypothetical protein
VRQVLGAISEFDKAMTVAKLQGARERKRRETGKCEGRKSHAELNPDAVVNECLTIRTGSEERRWCVARHRRAAALPAQDRSLYPLDS